ncbi:hypothetical protein N7455_008541 [Penicillium solitum]|uniref:uncharacterized protein n=1 Tax=Penicillium solitum TaxID=60172 RepID=UPI00181016A1|nr:hypothetical protein HAV15_008326 [Penicillium sp. str. \
MASLGLEYLESDQDSDPEIVPESLPAMLSTESLSPAMLSTESLYPRMPLPPLSRRYSNPETTTITNQCLFSISLRLY